MSSVQPFSTLKGFGVTFKQIFKKPITQQYPEYKRPVYPRYRGRHRLRVALLHTWLSTQTEGWWRQAFDGAQVPYTYISTQQIAADANLDAKYDVIVFPPVGRGPMPWTGWS